MSLAAIRQGLATNLQAIPEVQVSPCIIMPTPPTIWVARATIQPIAMGSRVSGQKYTDQYTATVQAMVDFTDPIGSGAALDQYMSGSGVYSVTAAIERDKTLGGVADSLQVEEWSGPSLDTFQTLSLLLAEWTVTIIATEVAL